MVSNSAIYLRVCVCVCVFVCPSFMEHLAIGLVCPSVCLFDTLFYLDMQSRGEHHVKG